MLLTFEEPPANIKVSIVGRSTFCGMLYWFCDNEARNRIIMRATHGVFTEIRKSDVNRTSAPPPRRCAASATALPLPRSHTPQTSLALPLVRTAKYEMANWGEI